MPAHLDSAIRDVPWWGNHDDDMSPFPLRTTRPEPLLPARPGSPEAVTAQHPFTVPVASPGGLGSQVCVWEAACGGLGLLLNFLFGNGSQGVAKVPVTQVSSILHATYQKQDLTLGQSRPCTDMRVLCRRVCTRRCVTLLHHVTLVYKDTMTVFCVTCRLKVECQAGV